MHNFRNLKIWQKSIELTTEIYLLTSKFPDKEKFGLISQINRCVVSIPSNIAEGSGRKSEKEFEQFLNISISSSYELETQLTISKNINYLKENDYEQIIIKIEEIQKMIQGLKKTIKNKNLTSNI
jgi:four helix bundle protein